MVLSIVYALFSDVDLRQALFYGIKPAVIAVVAEAVVRVVAPGARDAAPRGHRRRRVRRDLLLRPAVPADHRGRGVARAADRRSALPSSSRRRARRSAPTSGDAFAAARWWPGIVIWLAPTVVVLVAFGPTSIFTQLALFFSFAAVITFGGAYAILAFIAQQAVDVYGWLTARQMVDGLGLAESTPGPLIMVVQFVGFLAAFAAPTGPGSARRPA